MRVAPALAALAALAVGAGPAHATLLVRSDSSGLLVQDKNGLSDSVVVTGGTQGGNPVYVVTNNNGGDIFKFDFQANCSQGATSDKAVCKRFSGKLNLGMAGGSDDVDVTSSAATSASVNLSDGSDTYDGLNGPDDVLTGLGTNDVETLGGADDITIRNGTDTVKTGSGDDNVDKQPFFDTRGPDNIEAGSGDDIVSMQSTERTVVHAGSGNDIVNFVSIGNDFVDAGTGEDKVTTGEGDDDIVVREPTTPGQRDEVNCGKSQDFVTADLTDEVSAITDPGGGTCEEVDREAVDETPLVRILSKTLRVSRTGRVGVRLRCPRGVRSLGCGGRLQLRVGRSAGSSRSRRVRYRIRAGRRKTVKLRLTRRDVRTLRRQKRRRVKSRGILTSVERGRKGRKTTIRNPRLRVR